MIGLEQVLVWVLQLINPESSDTPSESEKPGDSTTPSTSDKPSDSITSSTSKKPSTKTSDKSTTISNDKEEDITTPITSETPTTSRQVKTPGKVNTPNNPINSGQSFIPVKNTNPGTFNGGVSSSVDGKEVSDEVKVDTGSPVTSILNKIRSIF